MVQIECSCCWVAGHKCIACLPGRLSNAVSMVSGFSAARLLGDNYYSSGRTMNTGVASFLGFDPPQAAGGLCACVP